MKCQQSCVRTLYQNVWMSQTCHCMPRSYSRTPSFSPGIFSLSTHCTPSFSLENKCPSLHFPPKNFDHSLKSMLSSSAKVGMRFDNAKSPADKKLRAPRPRTKVTQEELKKAGSILGFMPLPRRAPPKGKQQSTSTPSPVKKFKPSSLLIATEMEQVLSKR
jgi:hypothetical protein